MERGGMWKVRGLAEACVWWLIVGGCSVRPSTTPPADTDDGASDSDPAAVDTDVPAVGCAPGSWDAASEYGGPADEVNALYVDPLGDDLADGSVEQPLATVEAALVRARLEGRETILLQPGVYETAGLLLNGDVGIEIRGCGPDQVVLRGPEDDPVLLVSGVSGSVDDPVVLAGFRIEGGRRALFVWQQSQVVIDEVQVADAREVGVVFEGGDTVVRARELSVFDTEPVEGVGYGVLVSGAVVTLEGGEVSGSTGVGVLVHAADAVSLHDLTVLDTSAGGDRLGRAVQVQGASGAVDLVDCVLDGQQDVGLMSLGTAALVVRGLAIRRTAAGLVEGAATGDGIVVAQGMSPDPELVGLYEARLEDNTVEEAARAGILVADVSVFSTGNVVRQAGLVVEGGSVFAQGAAVVELTSEPVPHLVNDLARTSLVVDLADASATVVP